MNNRREEYLDLVLNILLEDSIITHSNRKWWLESPWIQNNGIGRPHVGIFNYILPYTLNSTSDPFGKYCRDNYGLTDKEIYDMCRIYHDEMWERYYKLSSGKLNESVDNKKTYLDKIIKWFVDDTIIDYEKGIIIYPFSPVGPTGKPIPSFIDDLKNRLSWGMPSDVQINCRDTYGLNYDETKYIWDNYKTIIKDRYNKESIMYDLKPINESVDKISKGEYINKIVDYLVDDTMVDQKNKVWYPPFPTDHANPTFNHFYGLIPMTDHLELKFLIGNSYVRNFFNYCKDTYGLTDDKEIRKVWERYLKDLTPIINGFTINESVNRKSDYLDKVVEFMIDDTAYNIYTNTFSDHSETKVEIWFPSSDPDEGYDYSKYDVSDWLNGRGWVLDSGDDMDYVCDTYSICDIDTVQELYNRYIQKLSIMIYPGIIKVERHNSSINESVDRKKEYLNRVADFLVQDSVIEYEERSVNPPFTTLWFDVSYICNSSLSYSLLYTFFRYCEDAYSLNSVETDYVWEVYSSIICDKLKDS